MNTTLLNQYTTTASVGYMGATKLTGSHSHKYLSDAELSKEIKTALQAVLSPDLKKSEISTKKQSYTGGRHIKITLKLNKAKYAPTIEEYKQIVRDQVIKFKLRWIWELQDGRAVQIHRDNLQSLSCEHVQECANLTAEKMAEYHYNNDLNINYYHIDSEEMLNDEGKKIVNAANQVIKAFNSNDSNAMVDYFDVNFYYDINIKWI